MRVSPSLNEVTALLRQSGIALPTGTVGLGFYGDSAAKSDYLVGLICDGQKRATSSLYWAYEFDEEPLPEIGDVEIVVNYGGSPAAMIGFTAVRVLPFDAVPAEFAAAEGEGDGSLDEWRREHWNFFSRECERIRRTPDDSMPVVCCEFELLHVLRKR
jgi:uncharacterized protein YhfF